MKKSETSRTLSLGGPLVREVELLPLGSLSSAGRWSVQFGLWQQQQRLPVPDGESFRQDYTVLSSCSRVSTLTPCVGLLFQKTLALLPSRGGQAEHGSGSYLPLSPGHTHRSRERCSGDCVCLRLMFLC